MTVLCALTLLPAMLGFTGTRLARPSRLRLPGAGRDRRREIRSSSRPAAERWAAFIQRRPVIAVVVSTAAILALAAPALGMKLSMPDESAQARGTMGYASYATMARGFGAGFDAPLIIAAMNCPCGSPGSSSSSASSARYRAVTARLNRPIDRA